MEQPLWFCFLGRRRRRRQGGGGVAAAVAAVSNSGIASGESPTIGGGDDVGGGAGGGTGGYTTVPDTSSALAGLVAIFASAAIGLSYRGAERRSGAGVRCASGAISGRHARNRDAQRDVRSVAGAPNIVADEPDSTVGYAIVSICVCSCSSLSRAFGRGHIVNVLLGRNVYLVRASPQEVVSLSLSDFRDKGPSCVRLGRKDCIMRAATQSDM